MRSTSHVVAISMLALLGCVPDVDIDESRLGAPRLLAVRAEPAEAAPGETVRYVGLYADASGAIDEAPIDWAYCVARKPLAELGPVARGCLEPSGDAIVPIGIGLDVSGIVPRDACRLFGPEPPPAEPGQPPGRPVDPDVTGGYRQPLRLLVPTEDGAPTPSLFEQRIACGVAGASQETAAELTRRYRRNEAPRIDALELEIDGATITLGDAPVEIPLGAFTIRARWAACPTIDACGDGICGVDEDAIDCDDDCATPASCTGAERYVRFDPASRVIVTEREAIRVAWYASGGALERERTGVGSEDLASTSENVLTLDTPGEITLVVVTRDSRGAASWRQARIIARE